MIDRIRLQPLVNLSDEMVFGYEALYKKENSDDYPSASDILKSVFSSCKYNNNFQLFINMTVKDIVDSQFCKIFLKTLDEIQIDNRNIVLEVSENTHPDSLIQAKKTLSMLRSHNIKIALDDFGTKYSTLSFMHSLPIDIVKIDQSFIKMTPSSKKSRSLLKFTVQVSHDLGCEVIAEGIETVDQLDCVKHANVDIGQGFLFTASPSVMTKISSPFINLCEFSNYVSEAASLRVCYY